MVNRRLALNWRKLLFIPPAPVAYNHKPRGEVTAQGRKHMLDRTPFAPDARFNRKLAGPARTLRHCVGALQRGDRVTVLTARRASERRALLTEVARLTGPSPHLVARIDAGEAGGILAERLRALGLRAGTPWDRIGNDRRSRLPMPPRTVCAREAGEGGYVLIDDADILPPGELAMLADLRHEATGAPVQLLLAGSCNLVAVLCRPEADPLWRRVRLSITLEEPSLPEAMRDLAQLEAEIGRTQARREAQKRILSIFADGTAPAFAAKN